ncbi:MAG TPA: hypothetical protein VEU62_09000, partial [Bryobacterales bacterium]|nr:hypothetical protein [Bryobacterales bacterium]
FGASLELDHPVAQLEPLLFLLARLLEDLLTQLHSHGLAANEIRLRLQLDDRSTHARTLRLPFPMASHKIFLKLLQLDLESHPPRAAIVAIAIEAAAADPRIVQYGLFLPPAPEPEKLELTLGRIARLVGPENLGAPALLDTHRPDAFRLKRFSPGERSSGLTRSQPYQAIRLFRPPLPAQVEAPSGEPRRLAARGLRGAIISRAGPWRTSGDWWRDSPWSRDEWDVALSTGPLCRIYLDHLADSWFVEGTYD